MSLLNARVENALAKNKIKYDVLTCEPEFADTAAFCDKYNFPLNKCANTILISGKDSKSNVVEVVACVLLATDKLDVNKKVQKLIGTKKASFASSEETAKLTGMTIGGVVIFGLPEGMRILVDHNVFNEDAVIMGGGNRSSKVLVASTELQKLSVVEHVDISQ